MDSIDDEIEIRRPVFGQQVAVVIRDYVLTGRLKEGERIVQAEWAERLKVSRMPVRDAISQLIAEGTLVQSRAGAAAVAPVNREDIHDGYRLNAIVSSFAARRAAEVITESQLAELERLNGLISEAVKASDRGLASSLNWEFHRLINQASGSSRLLALLRLLAPTIPHSAFEILEKWPDRAVRDHKRIIRALRARDGDAASELIQRHIEAGSAKMLAEVESQLASPPVRDPE
jgi:DNA-binding GntR family transcriptional regulator